MMEAQSCEYHYPNFSSSWEEKLCWELVLWSVCVVISTAHSFSITATDKKFVN